MLKWIKCEQFCKVIEEEDNIKLSNIFFKFDFPYYIWL